jgi:lactate dehydrogenase-like 2-hydroxyacid dehydrogenase
MKALLIGTRERYEKFMPKSDFVDSVEKVYVSLDELMGRCPQEALSCDVMAVDSIARIPGELIRKMPNLKLICTEGVGYNGIDVAAAKECGVYVCNNKGINASAVAEQTILLMLGLLRSVVSGHSAVLAGRQIQVKEEMMIRGITELSECRIGLIGFGDIAKALALLLHTFGCEVFYYTRSRKDSTVEEIYHASWLPLSELVSTCDIVSLHIPANDETRDMVNESFLCSMKSTAYLINTARGELVDNDALCSALSEGWIAGAALDTVAPEPVPADHPLLNLPEPVRGKLLFSPHVGGITTATFRKAHRNLWSNFQKIADGKLPDHIV